ncbi:MAG TPA: hypothetical protein VMV45_12535 [Casimicrobiaceae bacterium]|nr:hypothetical protein [Casimicrobiaceae bacterium]
MANWRWLLFALLKRFEVKEEKYLHIPGATAVSLDVPLPPEDRGGSPA